MTGAKTFTSAPDTYAPPVEGIRYNTALGYLRVFLVLLVVAHHSVLAYHAFAPSPPASLASEPRWWPAFPVVDSQRWTGFSLFVGFNDVFFMSLLFFISGLFVWSSVQRKGAETFLRDRLRRLGLPFLAAAALLAPLAYYPTYLQTGADPTISGFWQQWLALGSWPAGPAWFIWVLLVFDCIAALFFRQGPGSSALSCASRLPALLRPGMMFAALAGASAAVYVPMALAFNPIHWTAFGPFTFQTSRIFHYLVYFLFGVAIGACGIDRGLLAPGGKLARRWPAWLVSAICAFGVATTIAVVVLSSPNASQPLLAAGAFAFVVSCAASSFSFLALFLRFARSRVKLLDSLHENSYGIYLVHYAFVSWLQYALLPAQLPALAKATIVFGGSVLLSWGTVAGLRRVRAVRRVI
jgi:peptidoglycan/LPS O-acetylase OafA/YrhL